jgi:hypothetical protein
MSEPIGGKNRSGLALKMLVAGLGKDGKKFKSVAWWEPTSKGLKLWQTVGMREQRYWRRAQHQGRIRAGECAVTCTASWRPQICLHVGEASCLLFIYYYTF